MVTPAATVDFLLSVLSSVVLPDKVQAVPGSSPILPKISTYCPVVVLYNPMASSPFQLTAVSTVDVPIYAIADAFLNTIVEPSLRMPVSVLVVVAVAEPLAKSLSS